MNWSTTCLCFASIVFCFFYVHGYQLDIPLALDGPVNLTSKLCSPNASYVTKLSHPSYELHWLDNNPSVILYPKDEGVILYDKCLIVDFQAWREKGSTNGTKCRIKRALWGPYAFECYELITPFQSLKNLSWTYINDENNISWIAELADNETLEINFELIGRDTNRTFYNLENTTTRTLELLKDSIEFTLAINNYTVKYPKPENLDGFYELELAIGFLLSEEVKVFDVPGLIESTPVLVPDRIVAFIEEKKPFVKYEFDDGNITCLMQKKDRSFNISLVLASFLQSNPITSSYWLATNISNNDVIGFDVTSSETGQTFYYNGAVLGQTYLIGFAMSIDKPQSLIYDPNISLLFSKNKNVEDGDDNIEGSDEASDDLVIGLTVGLIGGALVLIAVIGLIGFLVLKYKRVQLLKLIRS